MNNLQAPSPESVKANSLQCKSHLLTQIVLDCLLGCEEHRWGSNQMYHSAKFASTIFELLATPQQVLST